MNYSKYLMLAILFLGQASFAASSYAPTYMRDLPKGTEITINQDLYFEPGKNELEWKVYSSEDYLNAQIVQCQIKLHGNADTSKGLLLKAPIVLNVKDTLGSLLYVVGNKKSVESIYCFHLDMNGGDYFTYAMSVRYFKGMLKKINGSVVIPPPPQE